MPLNTILYGPAGHGENLRHCPAPRIDDDARQRRTSARPEPSSERSDVEIAK